MIEIALPIKAEIINKKKENVSYSLSFNIYDPLHHFIKRKLKKNYIDTCLELFIEKFPENFNPEYREFRFGFSRIQIDYKLYLKSSNADLDNHTAIVKKFFHDFLTTYRIIPDDTVLQINKTSEEFAGFSETNHIIAKITSI